MIQLHYYPSTAAMIPHIVLEEIGAPFDRQRMNRLLDLAAIGSRSIIAKQREVLADLL